MENPITHDAVEAYNQKLVEILGGSNLKRTSHWSGFTYSFNLGEGEVLIEFVQRTAKVIIRAYGRREDLSGNKHYVQALEMTASFSRGPAAAAKDFNRKIKPEFDEKLAVMLGQVEAENKLFLQRRCVRDRICRVLDVLPETSQYRDEFEIGVEILGSHTHIRINYGGSVNINLQGGFQPEIAEKVLEAIKKLEV